MDTVLISCLLPWWCGSRTGSWPVGQCRLGKLACLLARQRRHLERLPPSNHEPSSPDRPCFIGQIKFLVVKWDLQWSFTHSWSGLVLAVLSRSLVKLHTSFDLLQRFQNFRLLFAEDMTDLGTRNDHNCHQGTLRQEAWVNLPWLKFRLSSLWRRHWRQQRRHHSSLGAFLDKLGKFFCKVQRLLMKPTT